MNRNSFMVCSCSFANKKSNDRLFYSNLFGLRSGGTGKILELLIKLKWELGVIKS